MSFITTFAAPEFKVQQNISKQEKYRIAQEGSQLQILLDFIEHQYIDDTVEGDVGIKSENTGVIHEYS